MFNKKLKRRIREIGNEITKMRLNNAMIQMMHKTFEVLPIEIKKIKEKLEKFDGDIKREASAMFNLNMKYTRDEDEKLSNRMSIIADTALKFEKKIEDEIVDLYDGVDKLEAENKDLKAVIKNLGEELAEAKDVLKEFIKVSGYDISVDKNRDYLKAYKVNVTKIDEKNKDRG